MIVAKRRVLRKSTVLHAQTQAPFVIRINEGARSVSVKILGRRKWFTLPITQLWIIGGMNEAAGIRAEKQRLKRERKRERGQL